MNILFAHSQEEHESAVEAVLHVLGPWYSALPLIIVALAAAGYLTYLVTGKNMGSVILVECIALLAVGFLTATAYPIVSVLALTIGLAMAGFLAFAGLAAGK